jgi:hypothetical protein
MTSFLFNLPDYLILEFLQSWLDAKELAILDNSLCSTFNRDNFLAIIQLDHFVLLEKQVYHEEFYLQWIVMRRVKLSSISLSCNDFLRLNSFIATSTTLIKLKTIYCLGLLKFLENFYGKLIELDLSYSQEFSAIDYFMLMYNSDLEDILQHCEFVTVLNIQNCVNLNVNAISIIQKYLPNIISLNVKGIELPSNFINTVSSIFPKLEEIQFDVDGHFNQSTDYSTFGVNMKKIEMNNCACISSALVFIHLFTNFHGLMHFSITKGHLLTDDGIRLLMRQSSNLRYLSIDLKKDNELTDRSLYDISVGGSELTTLHLNCCTTFTDEGVWCLGDRCLNLTTLSFINSTKITDRGMSYVVLKCLSLQNLNISGCSLLTASTADSFFRNRNNYICSFKYHNTMITLAFVISRVFWPDTHQLVLESDVIDDGDFNIVKSISCGLPKLQLNCTNANQMTGPALENIINRIQNLKILKINGFGLIKDENLLIILRANPMLSMIDIKNNSKLTANSVINIGLCCPLLTDFKINSKDDLRDNILIQFLSKTTHLESLSIRSCKSITDISINNIVENMSSRLISLDIGHLPLITDKSVCSLIKKCAKLIKLCIFNCPTLTRQVYECAMLYGSALMRKHLIVDSTIYPNVSEFPIIVW